jgi:hypothetical protein
VQGGRHILGRAQCLGCWFWVLQHVNVHLQRGRPVNIQQPGTPTAPVPTGCLNVMLSRSSRSIQGSSRELWASTLTATSRPFQRPEGETVVDGEL